MIFVFGVLAMILALIANIVGIILLYMGDQKNDKVTKILMISGTSVLALGIVLMFANRTQTLIYGSSEIVSSEVVSEDVSSKPDSSSVKLAKGDMFTFGSYPQGPNGEVEPIEWRVLAVEDGKALLLSEKLLDSVRYNDTHKKVTWEECTMRSWLNGTFLNTAFTSEEQEKIATTTVQNPSNVDRNVYGGVDTEDKIFSLSADEAKMYFLNDNYRMAAPTKYALSRGCFVSTTYTLPNGEKTAWWWLRSPGKDSTYAACVLRSGEVLTDGVGVISDLGAVRPAMWYITK